MFGVGVGVASLSIAGGDATGPFRLYGGSILLRQNGRKPPAPTAGPALRSGSPPSGALRGPAAYDLLRKSSPRASASPKGAAHLPPQDTSTRPAEVAICGV